MAMQQGRCSIYIDPCCTIDVYHIKKRPVATTTRLERILYSARSLLWRVEMQTRWVLYFWFLPQLSVIIVHLFVEREHLTIVVFRFAHAAIMYIGVEDTQSHPQLVRRSRMHITAPGRPHVNYIVCERIVWPSSPGGISINILMRAVLVKCKYIVWKKGEIG